ncbi:PQQ-binding-like beta-propeller repeat protein [Psychrosphaera ytuae]|uniref:PQQ-binding-like beta-propeller repeat protein n=1 Tax=Psychrosphaera ytuae TaxID=2820710 RepID=A0A975DAV7_9GAMM|nr:PQQ-like beta-propeller repeat protein [Psychrosphaera ytuae]QTH63458.1 PQQ-binding-like beta-propeller repeat protein [Psychrosphaera ytuae]
MERILRLFLCSFLVFSLASCGGSGGDSDPGPERQIIDTDGDGVADSSDAFPNDASESRDSDGDGVGDNADAFPNNAAETTDSDGDGVGDNADVFPNDATETLDSDGDGVGDNADAFPNDATETVDSDGDGVGDNSDLFPTDATESADSDGDGVGDNADAFPNDATETTDTDGDGVGDNADVFPNDATESADSDSDGVGDNADAFPNDPSETKDTDNDGTGDNADATPMGEPIPAWSMYQGNKSHNAYITNTLNVSDFNQRWSKYVDLSYSKQGAAADGYVFTTAQNKLSAFSARTGDLLWSKNLTASNPPSYDNGRVYVVTGGHSDAFVWCFDAVSGDLLFKTSIQDQWSNFYAPTIYDGVIYTAGGYYGGVYAIDAETGEELWWVEQNQYDLFTPAVTEDYVLSYTGEHSPQLSIINRLSGAVEANIADPNFEWNGWSMQLAPVVSGNSVLAVHNNRLIHFDLASETIAWEVSGGFVGQPVIAEDKVIVINNRFLEIRSLATGEIVSQWEDFAQLVGDFIVADDIVFARDTSNTYAIDVTANKIVWTLENKSGPMMIAEGALIVQAFDELVAIDVGGDIDEDGIPDYWERRYGLNFEPDEDLDQDGLTAIEEYEFGTEPNLADTDGDGLLDGDEVNTHGTSPLLTDTDGDSLSDYDEVMTHQTNPTLVDSDSDGLSDSIEINAGLDPLNGQDATEDTDGDRYSNYYEVLAGTDWNNNQDHPQIASWGMLQGGASHNGYQPVMLDEANFSLRWQGASDYNFKGFASGKGRLYTVNGGSHSTAELKALDARNGDVIWTYDFGTLNFASAPSFSNDMVFMHSGGRGDTAVWAVNALTGEQVFRSEHESQWPNYSAPTIFQGNIYVNGGYYGGMLVKEANSGADVWSTDDASSGDMWEPAVSDSYVFHPTDSGVIARHRSDGSEAFTVSSNRHETTPVLGTNGNILLSGNTLENVDIATQTSLWTSSHGEITGLPAVGNQSVYYVSQGSLHSVNEVTGGLQWSWKPDSNSIRSNIVATVNHIFIATYWKVYALSSTTGQVLWSADFGGDYLALGAEGALYVGNISSGNVVAFNVGGDSDEDGLPDWWEQLYGLDWAANDAEEDFDEDGVTNLAEYQNNSDPTLVDSDLDGLSDYEEIFNLGTRPDLIDSDDDGLPDAWEVNYGLDPLDASDATSDTDGDLVDAINEFIASTDPTNENDYPQALANVSYSFEDQALPIGFALSDTSTNVSISSDDASDGTYSLLTQSDTTLMFSGFFLGTDLSFDINQTCNVSGTYVSLFVDGVQYYTSSLESGWKTYTAPIPYGHHDIEMKIQSYCNTYLDNLRFEAPPELWESGAERFMMRGSELLFIDSNNEVIRTLTVPNIRYQRGDFVVTFDSRIANIGVNDTKPVVMVYQPLNHTWQELSSSDWTSVLETAVATYDNYLYVVESGSRLGIIRFDLRDGSSSFYGTDSLVISLDVDQQGNLFALTGSEVSQFNAETMALESTKSVVSSQYLGVAANGDLILVTNGYEIIRYTSNGLIESRISIPSSAYADIQVRSDGEIFLPGSYTNAPSLITTTDLQSFENVYVFGTFVAGYPELDSDSDSMPDWWEVMYQLDRHDSTDDASDVDGDALTAVQEWDLHTNPTMSDTDSDGLDDYDETQVHNTNPNLADSDGEGLSDYEEVIEWSTNPVLADTDADGFNDYQEVTIFNTDPNDPNDLPDALTSYAESFEAAVTGWVESEGSDAAWSTTQAHASDGISSLKSGVITDYQTSAVEFTNVFAEGVFSFDVRTSTETCCDNLNVYVNGTLVLSNIISHEAWQNFQLNISAGHNVIKFEYKKDGSVSRSDDAIYIDNIVFE